MSNVTPPFTIGVEEEFQIIEPHSRELWSRARQIVSQAQQNVGDAATNELFLSQIEIGTPVCQSLEDVRREVIRLRRAIIEAAEKSGAQIVASGTHPFSRWQNQEVTPKERYLDMAENYGQLAAEHQICGCHVHIGIGDREASIALMNRARAWMPMLVAIGANSPFWEGLDTDYASYRLEIWRRWPHAGSPLPFQNRAEYDALVRTLVKTGAISDETKIYWDIRPADRFETVEFRVCDVATEVENAVLIAALCRAIAQTAWHEYQTDLERDAVSVPLRGELMRAAEWRAARFGLSENLIDVQRGEAVPARELVGRLMNWLRPALEANDEWTTVSELMSQVLAHNGAQKQRAVFERSGSLESVVDDLMARTRNDVL